VVAADQRAASLPVALQHARAFLDALVRASHDRGANMLAARRQMRTLSPQLLAAYLESR
jgi:hypothetical protein